MQAAMDPTFTEYVRARQQRFARIAYLMCGDEHRAHDLVQEALVKLAGRWQRLADENPDAYVRRILYRDNISWWRRTRAEVVAAELPELAVGDGSERIDLQLDLVDALRRLPSRQRAVVVLRYFEDLTEADTAAVLGVSVGTVKSHSHAALRRLRDDLGPDRVSMTEDRS
ncbi:SigE family RNA polymerase sigma factor [Nostocoides jenkinsii]|uniref:RNA polymerase sigma-E factor n=1 Tax=Nostocoides jenkinsii Ben 74 TaxID=1193518 RepID=A0A077MEI1_9MICO|nr:SigE family RNA polymerase sigma factor [Tetrasphaera jenkinsii]CCI53362.1 RNA polymerase sigma-E factor [Tetrasphaera jenkinsii Ben 74]